TYFKEIFKLKDEKELENVIENIYKFLFLKCEMSNDIVLQDILKYLNKLKSFSELNKEQFESVATDYIKTVKLLLISDTFTFSTIGKKYKHIIIPLYTTFKVCFGKIPSKGCAQELIFP